MPMCDSGQEDGERRPVHVGRMWNPTSALTLASFSSIMFVDLRHWQGTGPDAMHAACRIGYSLVRRSARLAHGHAFQCSWIGRPGRCTYPAVHSNSGDPLIVSSQTWRRLDTLPAVFNTRADSERDEDDVR